MTEVLRFWAFFFAGSSIEFPAMLRDSLEVLYLNDNQLDTVPQSVCGLHSLTELYLSKLVSCLIRLIRSSCVCCSLYAQK